MASHWTCTSCHQSSRSIVASQSCEGETDEYMIFGRIGATELFIRIFIWV
ncbi:unnamed protein product [Brassica oleracea]